MKSRLMMFFALSAPVLFAALGGALARSSAALTAARRGTLARLAVCVLPRPSVLAVCLIAAGCGGSSSAQEEPGRH